MTTRRLAAILAADVVGYSRLIGTDEAGTLARLRALRGQVVEPLVAENGGRVFKTTGDGLLAEFPSTVQALRCAMGVQERLRGGELQLRVGVHQGDVVVEGDDLLGDGVNVAARLEGLAEPGGICISGRVREDAAGKLSLEVEDLGEPELKNIAQRHRVFRVRLGVAERPALALPDKPSLAVLPFQNMSDDPEQEYFADGIVEDITTALSRIGGLFVIARNSSFTYKGRTVDVRQVGRELGVRYVLEGSVRKSGSRVRITCQLIDAAGGAHLWADRFDSPLDDIFDLQDRVTERVAGVIEPTLLNAEIERAANKPTNRMDAYDLYLRALYRIHGLGQEDFDEALRLLRRALALAPRFMLAKAVAAHCASRGVAMWWYEPSGAEAAEAVELARAVLVDAGDNPNALAFAGEAVAKLVPDVLAGRIALDRALALNPNSPHVLHGSSIVRLYIGDWAIARDHLDRAMRLSPRDPHMPYMIGEYGLACLELGEGEKALGFIQQAIASGPGQRFGRPYLMYCLVQLGRLDQAKEVAQMILAAAPRYTVAAARARIACYPAAHVERRLAAYRKAGIPEG